MEGVKICDDNNHGTFLISLVSELGKNKGYNAKMSRNILEFETFHKRAG